MPIVAPPYGNHHQTQHQQRPPRHSMMVSMTQPPPVSMQGLGSMGPMMAPTGGMATGITGAMTVINQPMMSHSDSAESQQSQQSHYAHHHPPHHHPHHSAPPVHHHHHGGGGAPRHPHPAQQHGPPQPTNGATQYGSTGPHMGPHGAATQNPMTSHSTNGPYQLNSLNGSSSHQMMGPPQMHPSMHPQPNQQAPQSMGGGAYGPPNQGGASHHSQRGPYQQTGAYGPHGAAMGAEPHSQAAQQHQYQQPSPSYPTPHHHMTKPSQPNQLTTYTHNPRTNPIHQHSLTNQHLMTSQVPIQNQTGASSQHLVAPQHHTMVHQDSCNGAMVQHSAPTVVQDVSPPVSQSTTTAPSSGSAFSSTKTVASDDTTSSSDSKTSKTICKILDNNASEGDKKDSSKEKTQMCLINELARYNKVTHQYCLTDEKGPAHKKLFTVTLKLGPTETYTASGASIKKAQHCAADTALKETQYKHPPPKLQKVVKQCKLTPTVELNALAMKRGETPNYTFLEGAPPPMGVRGRPPFVPPGGQHPMGARPPFRPMLHHQKFMPHRTMCPLYSVSLNVGERTFEAEGGTAQQAKHNAAYKALHVLRELPLPVDSSPQPDLSDVDPNADLKSPISIVYEFALRRSLTVVFEVTGESGPPHMRTFLTDCIVGDIRVTGEGASKKISKKKSSEMMLEELRKLPPIDNPVPPRVKQHKPAAKKKSRNLVKEQATPEYGQGVNPISRLIQIQQSKKEKEPVYTLVAERGVPRRREFVMKVEVGSISANGTGPNKKLAKRAAAENVLQILGFTKPSPQPAKSAIKHSDSTGEGGEKSRKVTFTEGCKVEDATGERPTKSSSSNISQQMSTGLVVMGTTPPVEPEAPPEAPLAPPHRAPRVAESETETRSQTESTPVTERNIETSSPQQSASPDSSSSTSSSDKDITLATIQARNQLQYLAEIYGLKMLFTDISAGKNDQNQNSSFPYLCLVSLTTNPPHCAHGRGSTVEEARANACAAALKSVQQSGLESLGNAL